MHGRGFAQRIHVKNPQKPILVTLDEIGYVGIELKPADHNSADI
jgi:hypothetical protein